MANRKFLGIPIPFTEAKQISIEEKVKEIIDRRNNIVKEAMDAPSKASPLSISNVLNRLKNTVLAAIGGGNRNVFVKPEWDFSKVQLAFTNESIFRRAVEKYVEQIRKHKWEFVGNNPTTVEYIRKRVAQMELVTNKPFSQLLDEISFNLVLYNNSILVKRRNRKASGGKTRVTFDGFTRIPIAGYECVDPSMLLVDRDNYGNIKKWKQVPSDQAPEFYNSIVERFDTSSDSKTSPEWPAYNVIHIKDSSSSPSQYFFSMPMAIPVLADMEALRELEELFLLESIKIAVPKLHAKVGSKEFPGTQEQIDDLASTIQYASGDGILVTTERVEFEEVVKSNASNGILNQALSYFRERVLAGLGMSDVAMGKSGTSNRATAQVMSSEMQSTSAKFQRVIKRAIEFHIIRELLFESGYSEITLNEENMVRLSIPEVDLQEKISREAHMLNLYINNAIQEDELRKELGRDVLGDARDNMYLNTVQIPLAKAQADAQAAAAEQKAKASAQPTNQHGTSLAKPKIKKDSYYKLWNDCLKTTDEKALINTIKGSKLDPYDITIMSILLRKYIQDGDLDFSQAIEHVFVAMESQITNE